MSDIAPPARPWLRRRSLTIVLHWSVFLLVLMMIKGGTSAPILRWGFVAAGGLWVAIAAARGLAGRPGPKLQGAARAVYAPAQWGMYALVAVAAGLNAAELLGWIRPGAAWTSLLVLLSASALHGLFHFWRHTVLRDNALAKIFPRSWHKHL